MHDMQHTCAASFFVVISFACYGAVVLPMRVGLHCLVAYLWYISTVVWFVTYLFSPCLPLTALCLLRITDYGLRIWDSLKVIVPEYSCRVTLRTANWEVSFENVARIDFTWFSYCQNTSLVSSVARHITYLFVGGRWRCCCLCVVCFGARTSP